MKKNKKRSLEDFAMNISSKIKEIFIEIHDYNFFTVHRNRTILIDVL